MIAITNAKLVLPDQVLEGAALIIENGKIAAIEKSAPPSAQIIDAAGDYVLPGLIDLHTHGRMVFLEPEKISANLEQDSKDKLRAGVTAFLPTLASAPVDRWLSAMEEFSNLAVRSWPGAEALGVHYEGIFINPEAAGAQPKEFILPFNPENPDHRALFAKWPGLVKVVTFAAEVTGNDKLLEIAREKNIVPSLGHSTASPEQVRAFADRGLRHLTHLFNAMKPMHHRDPGPALGGLLDDRLSVELICDGAHVHPELIRLAHRLKPKDKRILVTDSVVLNLPGITPEDEDGPNRLPDGRLAGSRLRLCKAIKNYMDFTGCSLPEAAAMASLNPARLLGLDHERGSLEPGKYADFWLADDSLEPRAVFIKGREVFSRPSPAG